jgi:hypothetical protein
MKGDPSMRFYMRRLFSSTLFVTLIRSKRMRDRMHRIYRMSWFGTLLLAGISGSSPHPVHDVNPVKKRGGVFCGSRATPDWSPPRAAALFQSYSGSEPMSRESTATRELRAVVSGERASGYRLNRAEWVLRGTWEFCLSGSPECRAVQRRLLDGRRSGFA